MRRSATREEPLQPTALHRYARSLSSAAVLLAAYPRVAVTQLRPIEPLEWSVFTPGARLVASLGLSVLCHQTAALAGETGTLLELGRFHALVRLDRVSIETWGTAVRRFTDSRDESGRGARVRQDAGEMHVATTVLLTPRDKTIAAALRFGTGIPTTDDRIGLDRDETDFFASLVGRAGAGPVLLAGSAGVGIFGSRRPGREQHDVWVFDVRAERRTGVVRPSIELVGHAATPGSTRSTGNENLSEVRAGLAIGTARWAEVEIVRGLADNSPRAGLRIALGFRRADSQRR